MHLQKLLRITLLLVILVALSASSVFAQGTIPETAGILGAREERINGAAIDNNLTEFIGQVKNGNSEALVGVFVPGILALPVAQQPGDNPSYVSERPDVVTQFRMASDYGTTGLLAHNTLSGSLFFNLKLDDQVVLVYGDGQTRAYQVNSIVSYQALSPNNPYSDFLNLEDPGQVITAANLFGQVYRGGDQVIFQTCIAADGDPSWGRIFISAEPVTQVASSLGGETYATAMTYTPAVPSTATAPKPRPVHIIHPEVFEQQ